MLAPATFFSVVEVQALVRIQEDALRTRNPGTAGTGTEVAVLFSEVLRTTRCRNMAPALT